MATRYVRPTEWYEALQGEVTLAADDQAANNLLAAMATSDIKDSTVTRMIIEIRMHPQVVASFHEMFWGVAVVNSEMVAASVFPDADQVNDADWLVHGRLSTRSSSLSDGTQDDRIFLDIRSQRKLRVATDRLYVIFDTKSFPVGRSHLIRVLMKLA